jgi:uncharacterized membrane protein
MASARNQQKHHAVPRHLPRSARTRLLVALLMAAVVVFAVPRMLPTQRLLLAWNVGTWALLAMAWSIILTADAARTKQRAAAEDAGRLFVHIVVILSSMLSLVAAIALLRERSGTLAAHGLLPLLLCLGAVGGAWLLNHTSWTLRYAHLYYRDDADGVGGIDFPGNQPPDDMDFAYLAFTIGMCAQTSDVAITSRQIRRAVLLHSVQSFAFNTTIIALMLNLVFGLLSG